MSKLLEAARPKYRSPVLEIHAKMLKLRGMSDAIMKLRSQEMTYDNAAAIQQVEKDRRELRKTIPPLRLISVREDTPIRVKKETNETNLGP